MKEHIVKDTLVAKLHPNGIIEITWDESIMEISVDDLKKMQEAVCVLGEGKKCPLYFNTHQFIGISKDAQKYAKTKEGTKYTLATAILVDSLSIKLLYNFFMTMGKPIVPTKGFTSKKDCFNWLENVMDTIPVKSNK